MAFAREPVRMSGSLTGHNLSAQCTVSATRVTLLGTSLSKNCNITIDWVSRRLPEGDYRLLIEGHTVAMRNSKTGWQSIPGVAK
jgi:hypothetical protein